MLLRSDFSLTRQCVNACRYGKLPHPACLLPATCGAAFFSPLIYACDRLLMQCASTTAGARRPSPVSGISYGNIFI
jgi:hypothetical protein